METERNLMELRCPLCGYTTMVWGGEGAGMAGVSVTIVCETCRELSDAVLWGPQIPVPEEPHCPRVKNHRIALWTFPGACPKCGAPMEKTGITGIE